MDNERMVGSAFLGFVFFGFFVWMVSKVVTSVCRDLEVMFHAIDGAALSFLAMARAVAQLAAVLAAGAAVVYAAYRHYQLVKQATEIMAAVEQRCKVAAYHLDVSQKDLERKLSAEVLLLRRELAAALAEPEVGPEPPKALVAPAAKAATVEVIVQTGNESATTPRVSNPY